MSDYENARVLVVGCGGIGCELLKLLLKEDVRSVTLIDYDAIDLSNLNRQLFFTKKDIGKSKVIVAAKVFKRLKKDCEVFPICANVLECDARFFAEYKVVYSCLDNVEARSHVNRRCFISRTLLVDGGSGGFKGQAYYFDYLSECFDCIPKRSTKEYTMCTVRSRPTKFEHCIFWAKNVFFGMDLNVSDSENYYTDCLRGIIENCDDMCIPEELGKFRSSEEYVYRTNRIAHRLRSSKPECFDKDDRNVMEYIYDVAYVRGMCAGIKPMSFDETVTIAGSIIPSLSTTNAIIASLMVNALKSKCNYYSVDNNRIISKLEVNEKNPGCSTCSHDWYGVLYRRRLSFKDIVRCLSKSNLKLLAYSDNERFFTCDMDEDMDKGINFGYDTIGEVVCIDGDGRKTRVNLYFLDYGDDDLYFGRIYSGSRRESMESLGMKK